MQGLRVGLVGAGLVDQVEHALALWDGRDAVVIAVTDRFDADLAPAALKSRLHVPCENVRPPTVAGCNLCHIENLPSAFRRTIT